MFKPKAEVQAWVRVEEETKIEWSVHPHEVVLALGNLPEFEIVGTPDALRRFLAIGAEALEDQEKAHAGQ
ncbi:hypothetical protein FHS29_002915 [Saccharothrix tamanrassetensis]|uniref:Uncharacterized protein n=1 Tax=Saccharothrix tamanrassetensis TaxID=1051531 RepID=A0A841CG90_9PSEU|nr:hypothetical protein [Saccharothrix tamanrassetensis]MBB5956329.1 hypothetical protein [Saccharothrix tamanrassetensis]